MRVRTDSWYCMTLATQRTAGKRLESNITEGNHLPKKYYALYVLPGRPSKCLCFRFLSMNKVWHRGQAALLGR